MKRKTIISALALCACVLFTACGKQSSKYADYIETNMSQLEEKRLYDDVSLCGHSLEYHTVNSFIYELAEGGKTIDEYVKERGSNNEELNIVDYVKFADISKEEYLAAIDKYYPPDSKDDSKIKDREMYLSDAEIIYCGDDTKINNYFNQNVGTYRPEEHGEEEPTKNFFVTHGALARYVGGEKFKNEYLKHVFCTKYDNVRNFIEYFNIDRSTFEEIMRSAGAPDFYNIDELF